MPIAHQDSNEVLRHIIITGRLDVPGTDEIAIQFSALTASGPQRVVVDVSAVSFLASIGIRALITNAKALQLRGGRMVLCVGRNIGLTRTLEATGVEDLIPMFADAAEATAAAIA